MDDQTMDALEEVKTSTAKSRKVGWIKFAVVAAVTVALVGMWIGLAYAFSHVEGLVNDTNTGIVWMSISGTLIGNLLLYTVVDTLSAYNSAPLKIMKAFLKITGIVLMVVTDFLTIIFAAAGMKETNPWIIGLYGMGCMGATVCGLTFYWCKRIVLAPKGIDPLEYFEKNALKIDNTLRFGKSANPFVSFASLMVGYLLSVVFAYIGNAVHSFFYVWSGFLICLGAIAASIAVYAKKYGKPQKRVYGGSASGGGDTDVDNRSKKKVDENHQDGKRRMARIFYGERLLPYASVSDIDVINIDWESSPEIVNYNYWWNSSKISVRGKIKCTLHKEDIPNAKNICQEILEKTAENIRREVQRVLQELRSEYSNYGKYDVDCGGLKMGTCNFR